MLEFSLTFKDGGAVKLSEPFPATTDAAAPLPVGPHDVAIADFSRPGGAAYGDLATVWFRLEHSGNRHVGLRSAEGLTCVTADWEDIRGILHCARVHATAGVLI